MINKYYIMNPSASQSIAIAKLLKKNKQDVHLIGVLMDGESAKRISNTYDEFVSISDIHVDKLVKSTIPTGAISTEFLLNKFDVILGSARLSQDALRVFEKEWSISKAKMVNVPVPATWYSVSEIDCYPIFFKKKKEHGGGDRGVATVEKDIPNEYISDLIFQEYIPSSGTYGVGFIADNGNILVQSTHFEIESSPAAGGSAVIIEHLSNKRLEHYTAKILKHINYSGWGLAEFKYCPNRKDFVFMEINAKFWASCEFAFRTEPRFFKLLFDVNVPKENIDRIVFINRALARGPRFILKNIATIISSHKIIYPGWSMSLLQGVIPAFAKQPLKKVYRKICSVRAARGQRR